MVGVDYTILLVTLATILFLGLAGKRDHDTLEDFFLGSRNLNWLKIGASLFATNFSASALVGITGAAYLTGIAIYNYEWIGILALIFMAIVLYKMLLGSGVYTISEYLNKRYDHRVMIFYSIFMIFMIIFIDLAGALYVGGLILSALIPSLSVSNIILLAVIFSGIYVLAGGLAAISRTDSLQFLIIIAGSVTLAYFSFASIQLIDDFQAGLPPESFSLIRSLDDRAVPWPGLITGIPILCAYFWFANQNMLQWGLSAKSLRDAQFGLIFTGFLKLSVFFILVVPGVFAAVLFPGIDEPDRVYLILLTELLPAGALGLAMTGLVAALLSNTDSSLHAATTIFTLDLVRRRQPDLNDKQLIFISRAFTLVIMIISAFWAREIDKFDTLFEYVQSMLSYSISPLVTVYVGGIFYKRFTSNAAFYSLIIGIVGSLSLVILKNYIPLFDFHYLYVPLPICLLCLTSMFVITYFDTSYSERDDELDKNLTWSVQEHSVLEVLKDRQLLISSALLFVCTFLFVIYFA